MRGNAVQSEDAPLAAEIGALCLRMIALSELPSEELPDPAARQELADLRVEATEVLQEFDRKRERLKDMLEDLPLNDLTPSSAFAALAPFGGDGLVLLIDLLAERRSTWKAAMLLANLGNRVGAAVPSLIECLRDSADQAPEPVVRALRAAGPAAAPAMEALCAVLEHDQDEHTRVAAADALQAIGVPAVAALLKGLKDPEPKVRVAVIEALTEIGPKVKRCGAGAVAKLRKILADENEDSDVVEAAHDALDAIGAAKQ